MGTCIVFSESKMTDGEDISITYLYKLQFSFSHPDSLHDAFSTAL